MGLATLLTARPQVYAMGTNYVSKPTAGELSQSIQLLPAGSGLTRRLALMSEPLSQYERAFMSALRKIHDQWVESALDALASPEALPLWVSEQQAFRSVSATLADAGSRDAIGRVLSEVLSGTLHSTLACLDGASNLPHTDSLSLSGPDGRAFRRHLHEYAFEFLPLPADES